MMEDEFLWRDGSLVVTSKLPPAQLTAVSPGRTPRLYPTGMRRPPLQTHQERPWRSAACTAGILPKAAFASLPNHDS